MTQTPQRAWRMIVAVEEDANTKNCVLDLLTITFALCKRCAFSLEKIAFTTPVAPWYYLHTQNSHGQAPI